MNPGIDMDANEHYQQQLVDEECMNLTIVTTEGLPWQKMKEQSRMKKVQKVCKLLEKYTNCMKSMQGA